MSAPTDRCTIEVGDLDWIFKNAEAINERVIELDRILGTLRLLVDPRLPSPEPAALREQAREWVRDLEQIREDIDCLNYTTSQLAIDPLLSMGRYGSARRAAS